MGKRLRKLWLSLSVALRAVWVSKVRSARPLLMHVCLPPSAKEEQTAGEGREARGDHTERYGEVKGE